MYRTTNGADSWTPVSGDLTNGDGAIRALAMAPSKPNVIYAVTNDGNLQRSSDYGDTFTLIESGVPGWPRVTRELFVDPRDPNTIYHAGAVFGIAQVRRSTDAGATWTALDQGLPDVPVNVVVVDVRSTPPVIYAGADDGVYWTRNDGALWERFGTGIAHAPVIDLVLDLPRRRLVAGTQGRGAWTVRIGATGDINCDGSIDFGDIDPFVLALTDPTTYAERYAECHIELADLSGDGLVNNGDIDPFVALLVGG